MSPNVTLEISPKSSDTKWSRSLFNGLAQIIVQSSKAPGEIKLSAGAEGLKPAAISLRTQPAKGRPSVP
jgi:beta-galactosidase